MNVVVRHQHRSWKMTKKQYRMALLQAVMDADSPDPSHIEAAGGKEIATPTVVDVTEWSSDHTREVLKNLVGDVPKPQPRKKKEKK